MKFTPRPYQDMIIRHIIGTPRAMVWAGMGMGKTASALFALDLLKRLGEDAFPALILAPLRVAQTTWPDECHKWSNLEVKVQPVVGSAKERRIALKMPADAYAMNYENLPWLEKELGADWPFKTVIADESTKLKSFRLGGGGGMRAKCLAHVAFTKVKRFVGLTGTPAPNGLEDLWGQYYFVDRGVRLGRSFSAFHSAYFTERRVGADPHAVQWEPTPKARGEIARAVADVTVSLDAGDFFDIEKPIENTIYVDLPPAARKVYDGLQKHMVAELSSGKELTVFSAAALSVKCLQCASGAAYTDEEGTWEEVHDQKLRALEEVVEEAAGMPVLVAYHFKSDLERLLKRFPQGRHLDKDPQTIRDWNAGRIPILFAHPASAGHGLNLQDGGNILVFFSQWWNLEQFQQICERIGPTRQAQAGHPRPVFLHYIVARDTADEAVILRRQKKSTVQAALLESVKGKSNARQ